MSETAVAPAPTGVQAHEPPKEKQPTFGEKFNKEFSKLRAIETGQPPPAEPKPETPSAPEPVADSKPAEVPAPPTEAKPPASPLDAVLAEPKAEPKAEPDTDVLQGFDEAKPDWKRARETMKTQSARIKELEEASKKPVSIDTSEVDAVRKERDQLREKITEQETKLKAINAEYSDEYQNLLKDR